MSQGQQVAKHYVALALNLVPHRERRFLRETYSHLTPLQQVQTTDQQVPGLSKKRLEILVLFQSRWIG
ncbi:hypothetical protein PENARI_c040G10662 [Penicillium arizonense]|uniref:Uncharacterized protein n=1 Tax=Penicillium arizonense TaxID=1835702 RepID=A0A1F5L332_PENAI|nr:hypothetical protein PENARI_c040G10662 [Penicillium arizonense]OGE47624.1 hypothetical protein PENARI_c040G10662 [Penicillium arizonense]